MPTPKCHTIHAHQSHFGWNNALRPEATVAPGDIVEFETVDSSGGQLTPSTTAADIPNMDAAKFCPLTGPVYVEGAEPGDALKVTILDLTPSGTGWTANIPTFGLLADQFTQPALHRWTYNRNSLAPAAFGPHANVPLKPFIGTIGVAPAAPGLHSALPPRRVGGNMDIRDLGEGVCLYLPIEVQGALFSLGDTHAAQGDGEVCGTAIESQLKVALKIEIAKGANYAFPRFDTPGPVSRGLDVKGYKVTTGIGPDLMEDARAAVSGMIEALMVEHGLSAVDAYMLCSVCGDLKISDIVDRPNWVVSFYFPYIVFD